MKIDPKMLLGGAVPVAYNLYKNYRADQAAGQGGDEEEKKRRMQMAGAVPTPGMKKGGKVKSSASKRADGIAKKGKTRGRFV